MPSERSGGSEARPALSGGGSMNKPKLRRDLQKLMGESLTRGTDRHLKTRGAYFVTYAQALRRWVESWRKHDVVA